MTKIDLNSKNNQVFMVRFISPTEIELEKTINELASELGHKHPWAKVENIELQWSPCERKFQNFEIAH